MFLLRLHFALAFVLGALFSCSDTNNQEVSKVIRPVNLLEINLLSQKNYTFPGEVKASEQAVLAFRVPGEILRFQVQSGQYVSKGQLLIELDPKDYQLNAEAELANFDLAKVQHQRSEKLVKDYLISQESYDQSKTDLQISESNYKTALANLSYTKILAPYDGIIANTYKSNFEYTYQQEPVMSIQSEDAIDVIIAVPERLIAPLRTLTSRNNPAKISVSFPVSAGNVFAASFKSIASVADPDSGSYKVKLTLPKPDDINLLSGMSAEAYLELSLGDSELITHIVESALLREDNKIFVWKYDPDSQKISKQAITLDNNNVLLSGLNDSDFIVSSGVHELSDGQLVKPWYKERGL
ncbi:hypothetical protein A9Q98_13420 [Thalassotalea sp. 42_200_T64]|nr:hypothetical protein A9Q98_13420 [Thalassotalea sp. 42_200_T64]